MYKPSKKVLENYADLIINFMLWHWNWIKKWETVLLMLSEVARDFLPYLEKTVYQSWWNLVLYYLPKNSIRNYNLTTTNFVNYASDEQLKYIPINMWKWLIKDIDHFLRVESYPSLPKFDSKKFWIARLANWRIRKLLDKRIFDEKNLTWNISFYPTTHIAKIAWMTLKEYWQEITKSCYLDHPNPKQKWKEIWEYNQKVVDWLNNLKIKEINVKWENIDLTLWLVKDTVWVSVTWENFPSYEIFTSPNWKTVNWHYKANRKIYLYWQIIEDVELWIENWIVTKVKAKQWEDLIKQIIKIKNADKLWEFSLTDKKTSQIDKFMATILYDENAWWKYWNMHIAIGTSFLNEVYKWKNLPKTEKEWIDLWFNVSAEHVDLISTEDRVVKAKTYDWKELIIYKDGSFTLDK